MKNTVIALIIDYYSFTRTQRGGILISRTASNFTSCLVEAGKNWF